MKYTDIKDHATACKYLKRDSNLTKVLNRYPKARQAKVKARLELLDIEEAINKITKFKPKFDEVQKNWTPVVHKSSGFSHSGYSYWISDSNVSPRHWFISEEVSDYFGKIFEKLIQK